MTESRHLYSPVDPANPTLEQAEIIRALFGILTAEELGRFVGQVIAAREMAMRERCAQTVSIVINDKGRAVKFQRSIDIHASVRKEAKIP